MIHTLTLNPALDKILYLDRFEKNITNRVKRVQTVLGGKGTHVSINLALLGVANNAFGICHGETGARIMALLDEAGVGCHFVHHVAGESRTNYLLIESGGDCSIAAEPGMPLGNDDLEALFAVMDSHIQPGDSLVLSGDASNCGDISVNSLLMRRFNARNVRVFLDTSGTSLASCLREAPYMIKPNLDELSLLCGRSLSTDLDDVAEALASLSSHAIPVIAVTLGGEGSLTRSAEGLFHVMPPKVAMRNTIGCGDSFLAGFVAGTERGLPFDERLRLATAVSAATAESESSVGFAAERVNALAPLVTIHHLH